MPSQTRQGLPIPAMGPSLDRLTAVALNRARSARPAPRWLSLRLEGALADLRPDRPAWRQILGPSTPSASDVEARLARAAGEPRLAGLVLDLRSPRLSPAQLGGLRERIAALRLSGKRVIAFGADYGSSAYQLATAADEIWIQPGGQVGALGFRRRFTFWAEAMARLGLRVEGLAVSPYKSAADALTRKDLSPELRAMTGWLLDALYQDLVADVASGRHLGRAAAAAALESTPLTDVEALSAGLVDRIGTWEDLAREVSQPPEANGDGPAAIVDWDRGASVLRQPLPPPGGRRVGLLRIHGLIVDGRSEPPSPLRPPVPMAGMATTGDLTVREQVRTLLADRQVGAILVHVDSPGGSAMASESIASALAAAAERLPVVAVLGSVAASGGYYAALPAQWIVARPGSLTGSIGVVAAKLVAGELLDRLGVGRSDLSRGTSLDPHSGDRPFTEAERARMWAQIGRSYDVFLERVAAARKLSPGDLEAVAGGRVWTGAQALERGLVDELGGLDAGLSHARRLAGLAPNAGLRPAGPPRRMALVPGLLPSSALAWSGWLGRGASLCLGPLLLASGED